MDIHNLVRMANQIGGFYESLPDAEEASREIAGHLKKFWEPRMRRAILEYVDKQAGEGLSAIVLASIHRNKEQLTPAK